METNRMIYQLDEPPDPRTTPRVFDFTADPKTHHSIPANELIHGDRIICRRDQKITFIREISPEQMPGMIFF